MTHSVAVGPADTHPATAPVVAKPAGLIVHAAGPTDDGFRIVGMWESEEAWVRFAEQLRSVVGSLAPLEVFRALRPVHVVYGAREEES